jgi:hypothetical protein
MADGTKKGAAGNVDSGSGSKGSKGEGRARGPSVAMADGGSSGHADKSPSTGKPDSSGPGEKFASGGKGKMFGFAGALPATAGISAARES